MRKEGMKLHWGQLRARQRKNFRPYLDSILTIINSKVTYQHLFLPNIYSDLGKVTRAELKHKS